jgi:TRAP-type C4-dicarboxylate transport system substrate-binding protein
MRRMSARSGSPGGALRLPGSPGAGGPQLTRRAAVSLGALSLFLAGCGADSANPVSRGSRSLTDVRAVTYLTPAYEDLYPGIEMFVEAIEAANSEVHVDMFDSGALLNADQIVPGLLRGVADVVFQTSSYVSASYPILGAYELPFVNDGFEQNRRALAHGGQLHELLNSQLRPRGIELLGSMPTTLQWLFTVDRPVRTPEDVRGLRIRTAGHVEGQTIRALGGSPVSMSSAELYEALERGTIDGMVSYMGTIISRDLQQVVKYATEAHFGAYSVDAYANADWYASLPASIQQALQEGGRVYSVQGTDNQIDLYENDYMPQIESSGMELIRLDAEEIERFKAATASVVDWWKSKIEDPAIAEEALRLVREA